MYSELEAIVGNEWVRDGQEAINYTIDGTRPEVVVFPGTVEELAVVLRKAHEADWVVVPAGRGMGLTLGNPLEKADLVISTNRLDQVLDYEPADLTASVQAGCTLESFNDTVDREGQWLPLDPPQPAQATLGAVAAVGEFGPLRLGFGLPRDYIVGVHMVRADGRPLKSGGRVVKNVAGYDLNKLFVGSLGTLGVITQLNLKLRPKPDVEASLLISSQDMAAVQHFLQAVASVDVSPVAMELLSARTARHVALPCPDGRVALLVRVMESPPGVEDQMRRLIQLGREQRLGVEEIPRPEAVGLWSTIRDLRADSDAELVLRASVLPSKSISILKSLESELAGIACPAHLFALPRDGIVWATLQSNGTGGPDERIIELIRDVRRQCQVDGGHLIIERAPPEIKKRVEVWGEVGPTSQIMRALKEKFDPHHILNPGRFVAGI